MSMRRLLAAFAAGFALLALLVGVPVFLALTVGLPFLHGGPSWSQIGTVLSTNGLPDYVLIGLLSLASWLIWTDFAISALLEVVAAARRHSAPRPPVVRLLQPLAAYLVATILLAFVVSGRSGSSAGTHQLNTPFVASRPRLTQLISTMALASPHDPSTAAEPDQPVAPSAAAELAASSPTSTVPYVVRRGDNLWSVAGSQLGDSTRWTEIWQLNQGRPEPGGRILDDPRLLLPGWTIELPAPAQTPPELSPSEEAQTPAPAPPTSSYQVLGGDSLWTIAGSKLGDSSRWTEIWTLNQGRSEPNGHTFSNPQFLLPGWTLDLPTEQSGLPVPQGAAAASPPPTAAPPPAAIAPAASSSPPRPAETPPDPPLVSSAINPGLGDVVANPTTQGPAPTGHPRPLAGQPRPVEASEQPASPSRVNLPLGGVVGVTFATAVAGLVGASRLYARRRQRPGDISAVERINRLTTPTIRALLRADRARHATSDEEPPTPPPPPDSVPIGTLILGDLNGHPVMRDLSAVSGIGFVGPGADDVARAVAVSFLAHAPAARTRLLLTDASAQLLPGVAAVPGVIVVPAVEEALTRFELEVVRRSQLFDAHQAPDFDAFIDMDPGEDLPAMVMVTALPAQHHRRVDAVVGLGRRLGLALVVLGSSPSGETVVVTTDGKVTAESVGGVLDPLVGGNLDRIGLQEAADVLAYVAAGRGVPLPDDGRPAPRLQDLEEELAPLARQPSETRPVQINVMGPLEVRVRGEPVRWARRKAGELLALLVIHRNGADRDWLAEQLWPEMSIERAHQSFYTTVGHCRQVLRAATGLDVEKFVLASETQYQLDCRLVDVDLWRFEAAKQEARSASSDEQRRWVLEQAAAACGHDELLAGEAYEGIEGIRERIRAQAVEALCQLADMRRRAGELETAADAYEQALCHDQFSEELYRRMIATNIELRRPDAALRWGRILEAHLAELDEEPSEETVELLRQVRGAA